MAAMKDHRITVVCNYKWLGLCHNMYNIIKQAEKLLRPRYKDVAVIVDADDWISSLALKKVVPHYKKGRKITHGSYKKRSKGRRTKISRMHHTSGNIRKMPWRFSHLKTIQWKIIKMAKPEWFRHKGKWLEAASDMALMFPCIEIAGLKNVGYVKDIIYYWNNNPSAKKKALEKKCEKILRNMKKE